MEEVLRKRHTKKKFGVKVQMTNANRMKKVLEEDIINKDDDEESDLEIIEYPGDTSSISKIQEKDTYDNIRAISPLSRIMKKVVVNSQIQKCDQFDQLNLTLDDDDDNGEVSDIINSEECTNQAAIININNNIIEQSKNIPSSNSKTIYKKKLVSSSALKHNISISGDAISKTDDSMLLLSNVSTHNPSNYEMNRRVITQFTEKSPKAEKRREEKSSGTKKKKNSDNNVRSNDLKLFENYQKLKQLEQFQQLKELEKMKELIDLNNNVNRFKGIGGAQPIFPPQQISMPISYQNNIMTTASTIPPSPNHNHIGIANGFGQPDNITKSDIFNNSFNISEPQSCSYCEEIYQYTIMNNLSLKIIKCLYCNRVMNSKTLEYYLSKYKKDLELKYKHDIEQTKEEINEEEEGDSEEEEEEDDQINHENEEGFEQHQKYKQSYYEREEILKKGTSYSDGLKRTTNKRFNKPPINNKQVIDRHCTGQYYKDNTNTNFKTETNAINNNSSIETENEKDANNKLENNGGNISLAEAFKSRRAKILTNIEKRSNSVKENVNTSKNEPLEMRIIRERQSQKLKTNSLNDNSIMNQPKNSRSLNVSQASRSKADPSPELMNRLIKGEKAKMSQKEMKSLNNRLYSKLVDVKAKDEENNKKGELSRLNLVKKNYTNNLKDKVVKSYNSKKTQ